MSPAAARAARQRSRGERTLALDIGGTGLKATVLDPRGRMLVERVRVKTPHPIDPKVLVASLHALVEPLPAWDRVSVGFPGVVRQGVVVTAPNLGTEGFAGFDLARALERVLGPTRVLNDADMQGYGAVHGKGVEMVLTLGTGFGTALFDQGRLCPHLELAHHPFRSGDTYEDQLGDKARKRLGSRHWTRRVRLAVDLLREIVHFDRLYVGGGNARRLDGDLGEDVEVVPNEAGLLGGIRLWDEARPPGA